MNRVQPQQPFNLARPNALFPGWKRFECWRPRRRSGRIELVPQPLHPGIRQSAFIRLRRRRGPNRLRKFQGAVAPFPLNSLCKKLFSVLFECAEVYGPDWHRNKAPISRIVRKILLRVCCTNDHAATRMAFNITSVRWARPIINSTNERLHIFRPRSAAALPVRKFLRPIYLVVPPRPS